ncbi:hypothetical protein EDE12_11850 [Methylosinus sp. sav-2]|uniref:hypothetical protein n=1 Tax=Methylosinus sp. sav-2 TaxID=2485168 RepID=UPI00047E0986|nr:hypothetical protein [Methylosinus sp. sav-2]TDX60814.1 hypothetical protein EDE12_11850 [Methylosinus sp. sav-2]
MRFHVGRNYRADGERFRKASPQTASDLVLAARSAARASEPAAPRKSPFARAVLVVATLAAPLFAGRAYLDATRTEPAAIAAEETRPTIRQVGLQPAAPLQKAEREDIDLTATGSTPPRQEAAPTASAAAAPAPAKTRRAASGSVSRSAREISRSPESYR